MVSLSSYFTYTAKDCPTASFPLGGIGAGSFGIGAGGCLRNWEIFSRPAKGSVNGFSHFAVRAEKNGAVLDTRVLHGPNKGLLVGDFPGRPFNSYWRRLQGADALRQTLCCGHWIEGNIFGERLTNRFGNGREVGTVPKAPHVPRIMIQQ